MRDLDPTPTIGRQYGRALDEAAWTSRHRTILLALGAGWMLDSLEVNLVASFITPMTQYFQTNTVEGQWIVSIWIVGIMLGAAGGGWLADRLGRRRLFLFTLLWYSFFTVCTALAPSFQMALIFRFLTALGVGAEYSIINSAITELMPVRYRGRAAALVMNFWALGAILASGIGYIILNLVPISSDVAWRYGFAFGGVAALFVLILRKSVPESPRWLTQNGRVDDAERVLRDLSISPPTRAADADSTEAPSFIQHRYSALKELWQRHRGRLALGSLLDLSEAFGYYGMLAFLPLIVFPSIGVTEEGTPTILLLSNVGGLIGGLTVAPLLDRIGRHRTVVGFYTLSALGVITVGFATLSGSVLWVTVVLMVATGFCTGAWVAAYPTFTELFPTHLRALGVGISVAVGRIGAAFGVTLVTLVASHFGVPAGFIVVAAFWLIGAATMFIYSTRGGVEGRYRPLDELV